MKSPGGAYAYWLVTSLLALITWQCHASQVEVDWTSAGFSPSHITISAGDEVDIVNFDDTFDLQVQGAPPEAFYADVPPPDGGGAYYVPYTYNAPGTYHFSDEFGNSATVTVLSSLSLAITAPTNNVTFLAPATFDVTAEPSGGTPPYLVVQFFTEGTNLVGAATSSPFTATITNLPAGNYELSAVVTDSNFSTASNSIVVNVNTLLVAPQLTAMKAGNQIVLSWPTNGADGFSLQAATTCGPTASWNPLGLLPALAGDQWVVTNSISGQAQFFRLSNQ